MFFYVMLQVIYWLEVEKNISRLFFFDFGDTVYNSRLMVQGKSSISVCEKNLIIKLRCRFKFECCHF